MSLSISEQLQPAHPMAQRLKTMMNMNRYFHWVFALQGGFQLLDLIITELKSHMTC